MGDFLNVLLLKLKYVYNETVTGKMQILTLEIFLFGIQPKQSPTSKASNLSFLRKEGIIEKNI